MQTLCPESNHKTRKLVPPPPSWFEESTIDSDNYDDDEHDLHEQEQIEKTVIAQSSVQLPHATPPRDSSLTISEQQRSIGSPLPSPSWKEISSQVLPAAARELVTSSLQRICYGVRWSYHTKGRWNRKYSDIGNNAVGFDRSIGLPDQFPSLPPFSSMPWIERQLVAEWRTYKISDDFNEEDDFELARTLVPATQSRPVWQKSEVCYTCLKPFGPTRLRHHCRLCGNSFCNAHSEYTHRLTHLGYHPDVPERVCDSCKRMLLEQDLAERIAWRLARCRDYSNETLTPYFEIGVDTIEDAALRLTQAALTMAKSIPLGAQASVAVETVDVLRKYGLNGIYTIMLRQEFLAAADLLRKALGINRSAWPLSVHELSAAIFYALAQHRAMRGMDPEREHLEHSMRDPKGIIPNEDHSEAELIPFLPPTLIGENSEDSHGKISTPDDDQSPSFHLPVCDPLPDSVLASLIFYAPMALNFIYATKAVDMQLLGAQQGWRLLYAYLEQESGYNNSERPASAVFVRNDQKTVCVAIRGTSTIHDVITDIRQVPIPFPESDLDTKSKTEEDWMTVFRGNGLAVSGMAAAAVNLYREHIDSLLFFAKNGYKIRLTGHSLGGGVASLMAVLILRDMKQIPEIRYQLDESEGHNNFLRVYAFGTPSCVDEKLANFVESFVTTVVLHDDVVPRLTPASCRGLLKHLLHIRETWVKEHLSDDIMAITERAKTAWAPRWREGFTLVSSTRTLKKYCKEQILYGKETLKTMKDKIGDMIESTKDEGNEAAKYTDTNSNQDLSKFFSEKVEIRQMVDVIGGIDKHCAGLRMDGDEYFDPDTNLIESDNESSFSDACFRDALTESTILDEHNPDENIESKEGSMAQSDDEELSDDVDPGAILLDEIPLPRMYIPGKIVHIYTHRGAYRAAYVPRSFREIRRISLAGNMLSDHKCKAYYDALLEVRSVRAATENPPKWTPFDEDDTCSCCASRFTWASTSNSAAQEARDKHNCRSCGTLVCNPCSSNRVPLPSIGITVPSRVCDRCYHSIDGTTISPSAMTSSLMDDNYAGNSHTDEQTKKLHKPERERDRRSIVVDELVSRVQAP